MTARIYPLTHARIDRAEAKAAGRALQREHARERARKALDAVAAFLRDYGPPASSGLLVDDCLWLFAPARLELHEVAFTHAWLTEVRACERRDRTLNVNSEAQCARSDVVNVLLAHAQWAVGELMGLTTTEVRDDADD